MTTNGRLGRGPGQVIRRTSIGGGSYHGPGCNIVAGYTPCSTPYRVYAWRWVTSDIVILELAPCERRIQYSPGQYIKILGSGREYAFSVANMPNAQGTMELHVRVTAGLRDSEFLRDLDRKIFLVNGPFGRAYDFPAQKPAVLIAGGTGIVPAKCLVERQLERHPTHLIFLFWSAKSEEDLYLTDLFADWGRRRPNFHYIPVLSRPNSTAWSGRTGRAHELLVKEFPALVKAHFYVSGPRAMVEATKAALCRQGLPESNFFSDVH